MILKIVKYVLIISIVLLPWTLYAEIIFEDNFDSHPEWTVDQSLGTITCWDTGGTCPTLYPPGYSGYRSAKLEPCSEQDKHSLNINSNQPRGGTGKSFFYLSEPCVSSDGSWGSDGLLGKKLADYSGGYEELYISFYIKFQSDWKWNPDAEPMQKFLHVSHYGGTTPPYNFFSETENKPRFVSGLAKYGTGDYPILLYSLHSMLNTTSFNENAYFPSNCSECNWPDNKMIWGEPGEPGDGQWHHWEFYLKMNSADGSPDGISRYWYDGNLIEERTNVPWVTGENPSKRKWNYVWLGGNNYNYYSGGGEQWYAIDDFVISTSYIGPNYVVGDSSPQDTMAPAAPIGLQ